MRKFTILYLHYISIPRYVIGFVNCANLFFCVYIPLRFLALFLFCFFSTGAVRPWSLSSEVFRHGQPHLGITCGYDPAVVFGVYYEAHKAVYGDIRISVKVLHHYEAIMPYVLRLFCEWIMVIVEIRPMEDSIVKPRNYCYLIYIW